MEQDVYRPVTIQDLDDNNTNKTFLVVRDPRQTLIWNNPPQRVKKTHINQISY